MRKEIEAYLNQMPDAKKEYPFDKIVAVWKINGKMFALMPDNKDPARISLKCDPELAIILRERYESVLPGYHLNKTHWNTIILSGQLSEEEVKDLINHSYQLVESK